MTTLVVSRRNIFLRFYAWLYGADPRNATFCWLFWGLLLAPVALPLKPFGLATLAMLDRQSVWFIRRSWRKDQRTGKTWEQRHPRFNRWLTMTNKSWWHSQVLFILIVSACSIYFAATHPITLTWYVPMCIAWLWSVRWRFSRTHGANQREPSFIRAGLLTLKSKTCPRIEVQ